MNELDAQFPAKLKPLFTPGRYKIAWGGRGGTKSWGFARALLLRGVSEKLRILCVREVQDSIKQSVHRLLKDQIQLLKLGRYYSVLSTTIRGTNGTEFDFAGLSSLTVESIKSYEGYDICWVEEGQTISDASFIILIPTIRKDDSEIWVSLNPELDTDPVYDRFISNPPPNTIHMNINWRDNPWFNDILEAERLHCLATDPEGYKNIWDGLCKPAVAGAIYYKEIQAIEEERRIMNLPYDPMLRVHLVFDLGFDDSLSIGFVQVNLSEIRIINYLEYTLTTLDTISADLKAMRLNWGQIWLPHDGFNKTLNAAGKSTADILGALGWEVKEKEDITIVGIEDGIRLTRMVLRRCYFDKENTAAKLDTKPPEGQTLLTHRLIECIKRYHRKINKETGIAGSPVHCEHSHGADLLRYVALNADNMSNEATWDGHEDEGEDYESQFDTCDSVTGY